MTENRIDLVWYACDECPLGQPRAHCPICEGTGQYQAPRPPRATADRDPERRQRNLEWVRTVKEGHKR
jgi:hypothetical protein